MSTSSSRSYSPPFPNWYSRSVLPTRLLWLWLNAGVSSGVIERPKQGSGSRQNTKRRAKRGAQPWIKSLTAKWIFEILPWRRQSLLRRPQTKTEIEDSFFLNSSFHFFSFFTILQIHLLSLLKMSHVRGEIQWTVIFASERAFHSAVVKQVSCNISDFLNYFFKPLDFERSHTGNDFISHPHVDKGESLRSEADILKTIAVARWFSCLCKRCVEQVTHAYTFKMHSSTRTRACWSRCILP